MKKTYIKPTIDELSIEMQQIMAESQSRGLEFTDDNEYGGDNLGNIDDDNEYAEDDAW